MREQFDGWVKSSHHAAATCNSCHLPHGPRKFAAKASNGFWHSYGFTTGRFPDPIRIKPHNRRIVEANCRSCHAPIVEAMEGPHGVGDRLSCVKCHASVGHPGPE
jgi:cytochrome c nitrite reductase small subunit